MENKATWESGSTLHHKGVPRLLWKLNLQNSTHKNCEGSYTVSDESRPQCFLQNYLSQIHYKNIISSTVIFPKAIFIPWDSVTIITYVRLFDMTVI